jgi:hypothetical protein
VEAAVKRCLLLLFRARAEEVLLLAGGVEVAATKVPSSSPTLQDSTGGAPGW